MDENNSDDEVEELMSEMILSAFENVKKLKGELIEYNLQIEYQLDRLISNYFCNTDKNKNEKFNKYILDQNYFNMQSKINLFGDLKLHKNIKFNNQYKGFTGRLMNFNNARNDVAHNLRDTYNPELEIRWKGTKQRIKIDSDFFEEVFKEYQYISTSLNIITADLGLFLNWEKWKI